MAKRILGIVVVFVVGYFAYLGYQRYKTNALSESGAVQTDETDTSTSTTNSEPVTASQPAPVVQAPQAAAAATPVADSISPNPTNGTAFTGTGKFQVYRQGNLTWRVDTESGHSCILFATMEEWKKPIVYSHGCNNS